MYYKTIINAALKLAAVIGVAALSATAAVAATTQYKDGFFCTIPITINGATLTSDVWSEGWRNNGEVWLATASGNNVIGVSGTITCGNYTDIIYSITVKAVGASETRTIFTQSGTIPDGGGSVGLAASFDPRTEKSWFGDTGSITVSASAMIWSKSQEGYESTAYSAGTIGVNYNPNQLGWNIDQLGGPGRNRHTHFVGGGPGCPGSTGLPVHWVNTSFLSLAVEDTDFAWKSYGHNVALTRAWNMLPGRSGMFGNGWSFAYESTVQTKLGTGLDSGWARLNLGSGQAHYYTATGKQGTGAVTVSFSCGSDCLLPTLTGYLSDASGAGYYIVEDKTARLTSRYDYAGAANGESIYRLSSIKDRNGNTLALSYDANGMLTGLTDASNREVGFAYGSNGRVSQIQTFNNKSATFEYDAAGNLVRNVDLAGNVITYTYDANNYMSSMSAAGRTTSFTYFDDTAGEKHVATVTDALGKITRYALGTVAGTTTRTEPGGGIWTYWSLRGRTTRVGSPFSLWKSTSFNAAGLPAYIYDDLNNGGSTGREYDASGNVTKFTDRASGATLFAYDANGNLTSVTNPLGQTWSYTYDANGNLTGETSPLGLGTSFSVNNRGLVTSFTKPDGSVHTLTYDSHGNPSGVSDPLGNVTAFTYDTAGLELVSKTDPRGNATAFEYDGNRKVLGVRQADATKVKFAYECNALSSFADGAGNTTSIQRDALLRSIKTTDPLGRFTSSTYSDDGAMTAATDALGRTTSYGYDAGNLLTSITNPRNKSVSFSRPIYGGTISSVNISTIKNEAGNDCAISYDSWGLPTNTGCGSPVWGFTVSRDALGRFSSIRDQSYPTKTYSFAYDADGRLTAKKHGDTTVASYVWSAGGYLSSVTDSSGTKTITRDAAGQVTGIGYPDTTALAFAYDAAGNVKTMTYPGGLAVGYTYDALNRTAGVSFGTNTVALGYSTGGNLVSETRSNGVQSTYAHDAARQLTSIKHQKGSTAIADLAYTRDAAGRITGESGTWPLDPILTANTATASYMSSNALQTWGSDSYTYDSNGNVKAIAGSTTMSATYDHESRLTSVTRGTVSTTFAYDGLGNRVQSKTGTATRNFHHDLWGRLMFETNASGQVTNNYIYAGNRLVASGTVASGFVFYHQDKTGSTLALTDASGAVVGAYAYSPYGTILNRAGSATTPFTYVGAYGVMDEGGGLYFMKHRYYDANIGRFVQPDPIGAAGGLNLYAYAGNNPVNAIDPSGLLDWTLSEIHILDKPVDWATNLSAGFGDGLTTVPFTDMSFTRWLRGDDWAVDKCSWGYWGASWGGTIYQSALTSVGSLNAGANTILYTGRAGGTLAGLEAAMAAKGGGKILADTVGGSLLNFIDRRIVQVPMSVWKGASAIFAANAKGTVRAFLRGEVSSGSVWSTVEKPLLDFLGNATVVFK